ncbi:peptidyl-prolyl cis-trans isomerase G-like, partial [Ruditapes philippinarum]|uniref:peptidyl-prolyl cis-trans isomerase G-like n=1 Tax=Ruditapes philippinarum TaxID=129788 RepID=UPI00295AB66C
MPPPRKSSPRRRDRRSRSRSHSPRRRRSRSRSRDRRRSKSPQRRRSPERKYRSPPRRKSPSPRKRSRSPKRRSRSPKRKSRSHSPRRRSRSQSPRRKGHSPRRSPSPGERLHPVKRPADSSGKRSGFRSRTPSPSPVKRSREERLYEDEVVYQQSQRSSKQARSPVHESAYSGKMYADQPSSSKKPLFPSGSSKRSAEIDFVTIVEKGPKREKLNKRFETHDQVAHGGFDFEENITIGIHRGPQHIELNDDDDIEVNYDFNPKTFRMLFPKKESYVKAIFDRDEIKAFHHDDILDEEAYVEKRTISIKPVDKPKSRKYNEELDYKITVGSSREGYGDRRMVQDSGSRPRSSRSSAYDDVPVTVRLDPKPDPRYEKMYRDQQRYEDLSLMQGKVHRNPNDLRYNLMRRKSDGDRDGGRDGRERQSGQSSMMDARSRIEARRQEGDHYDRRDRRTSHDSPPRRIERKKATVKTDLPDFKNRPEKFKPPEPEWKVNPTVTPKGQSYFEHDSRSRDDMTFWERKQMFRRTGRYPAARGFRGRGFRGGRGRGSGRPLDQGFVKKSFGAVMDEWKHDKFDEVEA